MVENFNFDGIKTCLIESKNDKIKKYFKIWRLIGDIRIRIFWININFIT